MAIPSSGCSHFAFYDLSQMFCTFVKMNAFYNRIMNNNIDIAKKVICIGTALVNFLLHITQ